jgi:hypothetical protein
MIRLREGSFGIVASKEKNCGLVSLQVPALKQAFFPTRKGQRMADLERGSQERRE